MSLQGYERDNEEAEREHYRDLREQELHDAASRCPHCGNTDPATIEDNGTDEQDPGRMLLCVARVTPAVCAMAPYGGHEPEDFDASGLVKCGRQWAPGDVIIRPHTGRHEPRGDF